MTHSSLSTNIGQFYIRCLDDEDKYVAVKMIYSSITIGQAMIFCRSKRSAHALALRMSSDKHCVELLSSELTVEQRAAIIKRFRDGKFRVLVVTNVCARGIDIDDISLVLNFEFPLVYDERQRCFIDKPDYDTYLHRIGRAGRFGRMGHT
jgi:superfamily II DNA/RNA helicase